MIGPRQRQVSEMGAMADVEEGGSLLIGIMSMVFFGFVTYMATNRLGNEMVNATRSWISTTSGGA